MVYQKHSFLTMVHSPMPMNISNLQRHGILNITHQVSIFLRVMGLLTDKFKLKRTLKKAHESGRGVYLALLALNTTPSHDGKSPAFKLCNRHPCTTLPSIIPNTSRPILKDHKVMKYHDRRANDLSELAPGMSVQM